MEKPPELGILIDPKPGMNWEPPPETGDQLRRFEYEPEALKLGNRLPTAEVTELCRALSVFWAWMTCVFFSSARLTAPSRVIVTGPWAAAREINRAENASMDGINFIGATPSLYTEAVEKSGN
jgi:hypothetical protein